MKEVVEMSDISLLEKEDASTGLFPFMVAAVGGGGNCYNVCAVFHMIKARPKLVQHFGKHNQEGQGRKRKERS